jgi:biopolymer transport protein ExbD
MANRSRWRSQEAFEIPQTPLIDIIFILIVFFLVATTFYSEERDVEVQLPEGTEGTVVGRESKRFVVNIRRGGALVVDNTVLSLDQLEGELVRYAESKEPFVEVRGDSNVSHGRIMTVINLCKKHGLNHLALTQRIVEDHP